MAGKGRERRRSPRATIRAPVKVLGARTVSGQLKDISRGGVFVQMPLPLFGVGSEVTLRFVVPGSKRELEATGEIRYHAQLPAEQGGPGFGLKFLRIPMEAEELIGAYVDANWQSGEEPPFRG